MANAMLGYKLILEVVWSDNIFLPKYSMIMTRYDNDKSDKYYHVGQTNKFEKYTYRLMPRIIKK